MKRTLIFLAGFIMIGFSSIAQQQQPTVLSTRTSLDPYSNYASQGSASYQNNSQFYNKDNVLSSPVPRGNGDYTQPGNSNSVNHNMYYYNDNTGGDLNTYDIYSGGILIRYNAYESENKPGGVIR